MNVLARIGNVFFSPSKTFSSIKEEGCKWTDYIIPILLLLAMSITFLALASDAIQSIQVEAIQKMEQYSDAQKEQIINQMNSPIATTFKYVGGVLQVMIGLLISALVMWIVGNFIGGGEQKFGTLFVTALYVQMLTIPESIIKLFLVLQKETMMVHIGFGSLLNNPDNSSFLVQMINQLEFFSIWRIILWVIAFKVLYKYTTKKSSILVVTVMILGMLLMAGLGVMQAGRMG